MAKIPTIEERPIPQAAPYSPQQVQVADTSQVLKVTQQLGGALEKTGEAVMSIDHYNQRRELTAAKAKFLSASVGLENSLEQDPDVANTPKKYDEGINKIKEDLAEQVKQYPRVQEALFNNIEQYRVAKRDSLQKKADQRIFSNQLVESDNRIDGLMGDYLKAKDDHTKGEILRTAIETYDDAILPNDPRKPELSAKGKEAITKRFVSASLLTKSPQEQMRLIEQENQKSGSNITSFLAADQRQDVYEKAKINYAQQIKEQKALQEKAQKEAKLNVDTELTNAALSGQSFDQLPPQLQQKASKADIENYYNIRNKQIGLGKVNQTEEEKNYYDYQNLYVSKPDEFANTSPTDIAAKVPTDKVNEVLTWRQKAMAKQQAPISAKLQVDTVNNTLKSLGVNLQNDNGKNKAAKFNTALQNEIASFKESNKKDPTAGDLQKMADSLVVKATFDGGYFSSNNDKYLFEVSKKQLNDLIVPDEFANSIVTQARNAKLPPLTPEQIRNAYIKKLQNGK